MERDEQKDLQNIVKAVLYLRERFPDQVEREKVMAYYVGVIDGHNHFYDGLSRVRDKGEHADIRDFYAFLAKSDKLEEVATPKKKGRNKDGFHIEGFHVWLVRHKQLWRILD